MAKININSRDIRKTYKNAGKELKTFMTDLLGKDFFSGNTMDRIKSFEDACEENGSDSAKLLRYANPETPDEKAENAFVMLREIQKALVGDWKPNWNNSSEYKWFPYFRMKSGFAFSGTYCDGTYSLSYVGSRLCFPTSEMAEYAGKQFKSLYEILLNN